MIRLLGLVSCLLSVPIFGISQTGENESTLLTMVETERAFARMSEELGTQPAFMAFIAEDGILFRPTAVKGKQWMLDHPPPKSDTRSLLSWGPSFADIATAGDMGYTFGPWQFKSNIKDARAVAWGHFVTVWKKQADGSWKFAVDLGISHPESSSSALSLESPKDKRNSAKSIRVKIDAERAGIVSLERKFSADSLSHGARKAFVERAAGDVHVFRENKLPFRGKVAATEAVPSGAGLWSWQPEGWDVSSSGDLGYSYGTYRLTSDQNVKPETGNYFRIWKKQDGRWKVVVDVANPVPEKKS